MIVFLLVYQPRHGCFQKSSGNWGCIEKHKGINIILYFVDLLFLILGHDACLELARIVEEDMRLRGLTINWDKSDGTHLHERLYLGFAVVLAAYIFKVPIAR